MSKEDRLFDFITSYIEKHGYAPTIREMSAHLGSSSTNASRHWLKHLVRRGLVQRDPTVARGLRVLRATKRSAEVAA